MEQDDSILPMKPSCVTIQMKAKETFHVVVWFYLLSLWMKPYWVTIQMKATEQYFHVVLFIYAGQLSFIF